MEERVDDQVSIFCGEPEDVGKGRKRTQILIVAGDDSLGRSRRPRGEQNIRGILWGDGLAGLVQCLLGRRVRPRQVRFAGVHHRIKRVLTTPVDSDDIDQVAAVLVDEECGIVGAEEVGDGDQRTRAAQSQDLRRLVATVTGIQRDQCAANVLGSECTNDPLPAVGRPYRDLVTRAHATGQ